MTENALRSRVRRGLELTELGLGGAQLGNLYQEISDDEVHATLDLAWAAGIRYFDTAPHYGLGLSERRLGGWLGQRPRAERDEYVLSTKVGRLLIPDPDGADRMDDEGYAVPAAFRRRRDFSRAGVRRSLEESLERLGSDRIDVVYLHDAEHHWEQALREALPELLRMREEGLVRAVGAGMNLAGPLLELVRDHDVDLVMCAGRHTLLEQSYELLDLAHERGVGVVVAGAYNSGLLASVRPDPTANYDYLPAPSALLARVTALAEACEAHGVSLPEAALAFPLRHPAVVSVSVGAAGPDQLAESLDRYHRQHDHPIPQALWEDLASAGLLPERVTHAPVRS